MANVHIDLTGVARIKDGQLTLNHDSINDMVLSAWGGREQLVHLVVNLEVLDNTVTTINPAFGKFQATGTPQVQ